MVNRFFFYRLLFVSHLESTMIFACVHLTLVWFVAARGMMSLLLVTNKQITESMEEDFKDGDIMDSSDDDDDEYFYDEGDEF
jgi:hypothetical protein